MNLWRRREWFWPLRYGSIALVDALFFAALAGMVLARPRAEAVLEVVHVLGPTTGPYREAYFPLYVGFVGMMAFGGLGLLIHGLATHRKVDRKIDRYLEGHMPRHELRLETRKPDDFTG